MNLSLWAVLAIIAFCFVMVFATLATINVVRLGRRPTLPLSEELQGIPTVLRKLRKREPMTEEELAVARQAVYDRGKFMALCIPLTVFSIGCFYVFGSLEHLHGLRPSERTFLGVIPMFTSTNLGLRMLRSASLRRRLKTVNVVHPDDDGVPALRDRTPEPSAAPKSSAAVPARGSRNVCRPD